ncbi:MAG: amino acid adenylation domain-containing protein [Lachnospiraceae bacterium]|nr:amino acid adenylation domain-containing protein [Lachnospiraceae bacterium]
MTNNVLDCLKLTADRLPDKTAFSDGRTNLSFSKLQSASDSIGTTLVKKGCKKEPVLIYMEKSPQQIAAFFGVIKAGCFYVPIDDEMPASRIDLIIKNCNPRFLICDESTCEKTGQLSFNGDVIRYDEVIKTNADENLLQTIHEKALDTDPIYIVFTSGSTGVPKGVVANHRSVMDYIAQLSEVLGFDEDTVFGNQSPLYFDACLKEIYPTIRFGATTFLIPKKLFSQPKNLVEYLNEKKINTICWVVSALTMISAFKTFDIVRPEYLKTIAFGSEVFPLKQYRLWRQALPDTSFTNLYGPTEATGMSCYFHCDRDIEDGEPIPIGRPFDNTEVLLIKEDGTEAGEGEEGEIYLRGTCVTPGYYNDRERTDAAFVQNPLQHAYPEIVYRTGDMGRYNHRGELIFLSRRDHQIKHMGHRIELGEIEADVSSLEEIKICACTYDRDRDKIVLHFVGDIDKKTLIEKLKGLLPRYMLPGKVINLEEMPFTANGKIDRKKLEEMK